MSTPSTNPSGKMLHDDVVQSPAKPRRQVIRPAIRAVFQFGKFMITLPMVLVRGRRGIVAGASVVLAMILTQLWFPYRYLDLVYEFDARASWLVVSRDLALVVLLAVLTWPERRSCHGGSEFPHPRYAPSG